ncbi:MAG: hypothetical protein NT062_19000, partial [Proteobacteria bacterium]|nr:hypothetical protein [Pseudomonadota bacterium]
MKRSLLCVTLLVACRDERATPPVPVAPLASPSTMGSAVGAPADAAPETLKDHMQQHFMAITELQRAIARGYLDKAKEQATWIETHAEHPQPGWEAYLDELHAAAGEVAKAPDLPTAAS